MVIKISESGDVINIIIVNKCGQAAIPCGLSCYNFSDWSMWLYMSFLSFTASPLLVTFMVHSNKTLNCIVLFIFIKHCRKRHQVSVFLLL